MKARLPFGGTLAGAALCAVGMLRVIQVEEAWKHTMFHPSYELDFPVYSVFAGVSVVAACLMVVIAGRCRGHGVFRARPILIGMASGLVLAAVTMLSMDAILRGPFVRPIFNGAFYPELSVVRWLTDWFSPSNRDAGIACWLVVHPVYCILVGGLIGLAESWLGGRARGTPDEPLSATAATRPS